MHIKRHSGKNIQYSWPSPKTPLQPLGECVCTSLSYLLPQAKPVSLVLLLGRVQWEILQDTGLHQLFIWICQYSQHETTHWKQMDCYILQRNDLDKEKRWLKDLFMIWHHTQLPKINPLWKKPHTRILVFQAAGTSSVHPQRVVNFLFPVLIQHNSSKWKVTET